MNVHEERRNATPYAALQRVASPDTSVPSVPSVPLHFSIESTERTLEKAGQQVGTPLRTEREVG